MRISGDAFLDGKPCKSKPVYLPLRHPLSPAISCPAIRGNRGLRDEEKEQEEDEDRDIDRLSAAVHNYGDVCLGDFDLEQGGFEWAGFNHPDTQSERRSRPKAPGRKAVGRHWGYCGVAQTRRGFPTHPRSGALHYPQWRSHKRHRNCEQQHLVSNSIDPVTKWNRWLELIRLDV